MVVPRWERTGILSLHATGTASSLPHLGWLSTMAGSTYTLRCALGMVLISWLYASLAFIDTSSHFYSSSLYLPYLYTPMGHVCLPLHSGSLLVFSLQSGRGSVRSPLVVTDGNSAVPSCSPQPWLDVWPGCSSTWGPYTGELGVPVQMGHGGYLSPSYLIPYTW